MLFTTCVAPTPFAISSLEFELVHRDDLPRAADARTLHDRQADAAATEHRNGLAGLHARTAQCRADAGQHAAAHQRGAVQRDFRIDAHDGVLVQQHVVGVTADGGEQAQRLAVLRHARGGGIIARDDAAGAEIGMASEALRTGAAEAGQAGDDVIADAHGGDVLAHRLDDAGAFMAEQEGAVEREAAVAVDHVQIAVADAGGDRAHQDLAAPRLVDVHLLDRQRFVHLAEDRGCHLHGGRPPVIGRDVTADPFRRPASPGSRLGSRQ